MTRYQIISNSLDIATNYFDEMNARRKKAGLDELRQRVRQTQAKSRQALRRE
jgi:hypothetical protein